MAAMGTTLGNGFQSTLPRGERLVKPCCLKYPFNFNPRSREGSDAILSRDPRNAEISIHAPARGATMQAQKRAILQRISIHAPARGATRSLFRIAKAGSYFNPRSREGSDVNPLPRRGASIRFQSTLPRGERQESTGRFPAPEFISIHAPARGATPQ